MTSWKSSICSSLGRFCSMTVRMMPQMLPMSSLLSLPKLLDMVRRKASKLLSSLMAGFMASCAKPATSGMSTLSFLSSDSSSSPTLRKAELMSLPTRVMPEAVACKEDKATPWAVLVT